MKLFAYDSIANKRISVISVGSVADSESNLLIPMFAFFTGKVLRSDGKKVVVYSPFISTEVRDINGYHRRVAGGKYFDKVITGVHAYVNAYDQKYYFHKHCMYQIDDQFNTTFMFVLCLERDYFLSINSLNIELDKSKLVLIVNSEIETEKHHYLKLRFNKYKKEHLECIDTLYTSDVEKYCFQNNLKTVKFKSVIERVNYLNGLKNNFNGKITS